MSSAAGCYRPKFKEIKEWSAVCKGWYQVWTAGWPSLDIRLSLCDFSEWKLHQWAAGRSPKEAVTLSGQWLITAFIVYKFFFYSRNWWKWSSESQLMSSDDLFFPQLRDRVCCRKGGRKELEEEYWVILRLVQHQTKHPTGFTYRPPLTLMAFYHFFRKMTFLPKSALLFLPQYFSGLNLLCFVQFIL